MTTHAAEQVSRLERHGRVLVVVIDSPPVNALGQAVRQALVDAVEAANADVEIDALVIRCDGRTFFAGADIREFGRPPEPPFLPDVVDRIEGSRKPVVAAIHGTALGGGLEVAMGCHFRISTPTAKFGLPEVKLGLMPGAGGTQRLPRLVGIEKSLSMVTSGDPIDAAEAEALGLVDRVAAGDLADAALAFAREVVETERPVLPTRERDDRLRDGRDPALFDSFLKANARKFRGLDAPAAIVAAVRDGLARPFAEAMVAERAAFLRLREGPQSRALRHAFFAEREAARVPGLGGVAPLPVSRVAIIGAGTMGSGISLAFLAAGFAVTLIESAQAGLDRGMKIIGSTLDRNVASGRMSAPAAAEARGRLVATLEFESVAEADLVIEAAFETMEVKQNIFARLDRHAKPGAILATNTSYLDIDAIAAVTSRPEQVLGLHFFSPANIMKLLEVVRGAHTSKTVLATALDIAKRIGKIAVVAGNGYGFIGNRMLAVRRREAEAMVLEGASPYAVDRVAEGFGMPMGPFRIGDLAGLDLGWSAASSTGSTIRERLCEIGRRGQKSGAGYYDHVDGKAQPSDLVIGLIRGFAAEKGIVQREIDDTEILARLLYPMINEGAKILEEGKAIRASDIDVVWMHGYGWPRWTGGPMHYADSVGLTRLVETLEGLGEENAVAPLMRRLAGAGSSFAEFDQSKSR